MISTLIFLMRSRILSIRCSCFDFQRAYLASPTRDHTRKEISVFFNQLVWKSFYRFTIGWSRELNAWPSIEMSSTFFEASASSSTTSSKRWTASEWYEKRLAQPHDGKSEIRSQDDAFVWWSSMVERWKHWIRALPKRHSKPMVVFVGSPRGCAFNDPISSNPRFSTLQNCRIPNRGEFPRAKSSFSIGFVFSLNPWIESFGILEWKNHIEKERLHNMHYREFFSMDFFKTSSLLDGSPSLLRM